MSVFVSITDRAGSFILADAATYDADGVVRKIASKIFTATRVPLAVVTRGHAEAGARIAEYIANLADGGIVSEIIEGLQSIADTLKDIFGDRLTGPNVVQVLVSGWIEGVGGVHRSFSTDRYIQGMNKDAWQVFEPPANFATGPYLDTADIVAAGVSPKAVFEPMAAFVRRAGPVIHEVMRSRSAPVFGTDIEVFGVGGRAELATIMQAGVTVETLKVWDDKIGRKINPIGRLDTVKAMPGNRRERRAAEARKGAA